MEGTRLRILQLLQREGHATVDGLAKAIGLAPATIRRHLDILQRDRLVAFEEVRKKTGRPEYSFFLTEDGQEALPKDYDVLLDLVIRELAEMKPGDTSGLGGSEILDQIFRSMSDKVWNEYREEIAGKSVRQRLETLIDLLTQEDFSPEVNVEVESGTLRVRLLNCPYRSVAMQNHAICTYDERLIGTILDLTTVRDSSIQHGQPGCTYSATIDPAEASSLSGLAGRVS
jgi:predicted ArsR family transcriptional regulator